MFMVFFLLHKSVDNFLAILSKYSPFVKTISLMLFPPFQIKMTHSIDTDEDYILRLNRQTEDFVIKQIIEVRKENVVLKTEMSRMADQIKGLEEVNKRITENENGLKRLVESIDQLKDEGPHRSCVETMKTAFLSGFTSILYPAPQPQEPMENPEASTSSFQPSDVLSSTLRDESSTSKGPYTAVRELSLKRKKPHTSTPK